MTNEEQPDKRSIAATPIRTTGPKRRDGVAMVLVIIEERDLLRMCRWGCRETDRWMDWKECNEVRHGEGVRAIIVRAREWSDILARQRIGKRRKT